MEGNKGYFEDGWSQTVWRDGLAQTDFARDASQAKIRERFLSKEWL